jgi:hypothetical protein
MNGWPVVLGVMPRKIIRTRHREPQQERKHFMKCNDCGKLIDMRNADDVVAHEQACDGALTPLHRDLG